MRIQKRSDRVEKVAVLGGGLAGCEAAYRIAAEGFSVDLFEMRPVKGTPAHNTDLLAEVVCSNSFKNSSETTLAGLLKRDLKLADSLLIPLAEKFSVPAGKALAVDRDLFSSAVTQTIEAHERITVIREEALEIPAGYDAVVVASGPLTSDSLAKSLSDILGEEELYFYDAIAPVVESGSIDMNIAFLQDRYGEPGSGDYLNLPIDKERYESFIDNLLAAKAVEFRDFEKGYYFDACLPIEEIARRGRDSLAFGPLKPVGLTDPATGRRAHAVVQLRKENIAGSAYNIVGFQTKLTYPEQKRVFSMIPGLENAQFVKFGSLHRNTYIDSPKVLDSDLSLRDRPDVYIAGQMTGVEGYVESMAIGLLAGIFVASRLKGETAPLPPPTSTFGALLAYVTSVKEVRFQPSNINFSLFPPLEVKIKARKERRHKIVERASMDMIEWVQAVSTSDNNPHLFKSYENP